MRGCNARVTSNKRTGNLFDGRIYLDENSKAKMKLFDEKRSALRHMSPTQPQWLRVVGIGQLLFFLGITGCAPNRLEQVQRGMPPGFERDLATASDDVAMQQQIFRATFNPNFRLRLAAITHRANQGDRQAQLTMALIHEYGAPSYQNPQEAFLWYRKAAENGLPTAQFTVATRYATGKGTAQDFTQAFSWYCKAAEAGAIPAM